jgi:dihydroxyacetone kinase
LIIKNYTGDLLNFGLAAEIARASGILVETVIVGDDVAIDEGSSPVGRRGIAGTVLVHKVAGAAAEAGLSLLEVKAEAEAASAALFSMGLGLGGCVVPSADMRRGELPADEVEYGLGIHGESGMHRAPIASADEMLDVILDKLIQSSRLAAGDRVGVLVNNLGGTAVQELSIAAKHALRRIRGAGAEPELMWVGSFLTALEMPGCSISIIKLDERRLKRLQATSAASAWVSPSRPASALTAVNIPDEAGGSERLGPAWRDASHESPFVDAISAVVMTLEGSEALLTDLDTKVGDGDLGISLARGADAVREQLAQLDVTHPADALREISAVLRRSLGGSSGPFYSIFVLRAATSLAKADDPAQPQVWAEAFQAGCEGIQSLGGASTGDRTMMDALLPAVAAMKEAVDSGRSASEAMREAAMAAEAGAEATKAMLPRLGRSVYLSTRALGHVDPGAWAVALWLRAISSTI